VAVLTRCAAAVRAQGALRRQGPPRRGSTRRSGQRSLIVRVGQPPSPPLPISLSPPLSRVPLASMACAIRRPQPRGTSCRLGGHRSLFGDSARSASFEFHRCIFVVAFGPLPWPPSRCHPGTAAASCAAPSMAPRLPSPSAAASTVTLRATTCVPRRPDGHRPERFRRDRKPGRPNNSPVAAVVATRPERSAPSRSRRSEYRIPGLTLAKPP
jgi:hypothetical protein